MTSEIRNFSALSGDKSDSNRTQLNYNLNGVLRLRSPNFSLTLWLRSHKAWPPLMLPYSDLLYLLIGPDHGFAFVVAG